MSGLSTLAEPVLELHGPDAGVGVVLDLLETTSEWAQVGPDLAPSGRLVTPKLPEQALPSGAAPWPFPQLVRGGAVFGFVMAAGILSIGTEGPNRGAPDRARDGTRVPVVPAPAPRRRDDDTPADVGMPVVAPVPAGVPLTAAAPGGATSASTADATEVEDLTALTAQDQVRAVQEALTLSVTQVAEVLGVTRPTVYGYLNGTVDVPRDPATAGRLRDLYRVAKQFRARSAETLGRLIAAPLGDHQPSLLALLSMTEWNRAAIDEAVITLAARLEARRQERGARQARGIENARPVTPESVELERLNLRLGGIG